MPTSGTDSLVGSGALIGPFVPTNAKSPAVSQEPSQSEVRREFDLLSTSIRILEDHVNGLVTRLEALLQPLQALPESSESEKEPDAVTGLGQMIRSERNAIMRIRRTLMDLNRAIAL